MYFVPMFDDTTGYYDSGTAVSSPVSCITFAQDLTCCSGGLIGATSSTGSLAGSLHGLRLETGPVQTVVACLPTCLS